jgi:hypothetical protein
MCWKSGGFMKVYGETPRENRAATRHERQGQAPNSALPDQSRLAGWAKSIRRLIARLLTPARDKRPSGSPDIVPCPICKGDMEAGSETCPNCTMLIW